MSDLGEEEALSSLILALPISFLFNLLHSLVELAIGRYKAGRDKNGRGRVRWHGENLLVLD